MTSKNDQERSFELVRIETGRLVIVPYGKEHAKRYYRVVRANSDALKEWVWWAAPEHLESVDDEFETRHDEKREEFQRGDDFRFVVLLRAAGVPDAELEVIGGIGLHRPEWSVPRCDIGYWLAQSHWGCGLASEAAHAVLRFGFAVARFECVQLRCDARNSASIRFAERNRFHRDGVLRSDTRHYATGDLRDTVVFSMLRDEWTDA